MSRYPTLQTSLAILRTAPYPMHVRAIIAEADRRGLEFATRAVKAENVIWRDLSMAAKIGRLVERVAPGVYRAKTEGS